MDRRAPRVRLFCGIPGALQCSDFASFGVAFRRADLGCNASLLKCFPWAVTCVTMVVAQVVGLQLETTPPLRAFREARESEKRLGGASWTRSSGPFRYPASHVSYPRRRLCSASMSSRRNISSRHGIDNGVSTPSAPAICRTRPFVTPKACATSGVVITCDSMSARSDVCSCRDLAITSSAPAGSPGSAHAPPSLSLKARRGPYLHRGPPVRHRQPVTAHQCPVRGYQTSSEPHSVLSRM